MEVADRLKAIDVQGKSFFRLNGDEFVYILNDTSKIEQMSKNIIGVFKKPFHFSNYDFFSSVSMGISIFPDHGNEVEELLVSADMALYNAKKSKGNQYSIYQLKMKGLNDKGLMFESKLFQAIKEDRLEIYYQPKIDIRTNEMVGMEALLRWKDPEIITLAHALNLAVVAEGVESELELEILKEHNCEFVQGYLYSKPLTVSDFSKKLEGISG